MYVTISIRTRTCPNCGAEIDFGVETADGIPRETEAECECGKIPVFAVLWAPDIWIEGFDHYYEPVCLGDAGQGVTP